MNDAAFVEIERRGAFGRGKPDNADLPAAMVSPSARGPGARAWPGAVSILVHLAVISPFLAQYAVPPPVSSPPMIIEMGPLPMPEAPAAPSVPAMAVPPPKELPTPAVHRPAPSRRQPVPQPSDNAVRSAAPPSPMDSPAVPPAPAQAPAATGDELPSSSQSKSARADGQAEMAASPPGYRLGAQQTPAPGYPWNARRRGHEGTVVVRLDVDAEGHPVKTEITRSSGDDELDEAALEALRQWRLRPAMLNGTPVAGHVVVPVQFKLE